MLFWIGFIMFVVSLTLAIVLFEWDFDTASLLSAIIAAITGAFVVVSAILFVASYTTADADVKAKEALYESLVYQCENDFYNNDNEVGKFQLVEKVAEWNTDLAKHKSLQRDFWLGIYVPDIYDDFEFIDLNLLQKGGNS